MERQGLLVSRRHEDDTDESDRTLLAGGNPSAGRAHQPMAIASLLSLAVLVNLTMALYQLPVNRVIERRLCREYYAIQDPPVLDPSREIPERMCKVDKVQQDLAWIQGAMETAWILGGQSLS